MQKTLLARCDLTRWEIGKNNQNSYNAVALIDVDQRIFLFAFFWRAMGFFEVFALWRVSNHFVLTLTQLPFKHRRAPFFILSAPTHFGRWRSVVSLLGIHWVTNPKKDGLWFNSIVRFKKPSKCSRSSGNPTLEVENLALFHWARCFTFAPSVFFNPFPWGGWIPPSFSFATPTFETERPTCSGIYLSL